MDGSEETQLLEMCSDDKVQSNAALRSYFNKHAGGLKGAIKRMLVIHNITTNVDDMAEEVLHDVVVIMANKAANNDLLSVRSLDPYIYRTAMLYTCNYLKKGAKRRDKTVDDAAFQAAVEAQSVKDEVDSQEDGRLSVDLAKCIDELEGKQKQYVKIMAQHIMTPLEPSELADIVGVSPESVRNRLHEARLKLANCLEKKGHPNPLGARGGQA